MILTLCFNLCYLKFYIINHLICMKKSNYSLEIKCDLFPGKKVGV